MVRGPTKGSKRYTCRNEACEKFGRIQYLAPWANKRCRHCGSENIEEVTSGEKPKLPGLPAADTSPSATSATPQEPSAALAESPSVEDEEETPPPPAAAGAAPAPEPPAEPPLGESEPGEVEEPPTLGVGATPEPAPAAPVIKPKNGDLVYCKDCGWAVYWDDRFHRKSMCHAAACGSSNIEIKLPVEGK